MYHKHFNNSPESQRRRDTIGSRAMRRFQRIVSIADFRDLEYYAETQSVDPGRYS